MTTPAELRSEAMRCVEASRKATDPTARTRLAARALELAQQAEALERRTVAAAASAKDHEKKQG